MSQAMLREQRKQKLKEREASGQPITARCGEQKIGLAKYYYWKRKLRSKNRQHLATQDRSTCYRWN